MRGGCFVTIIIQKHSPLEIQQLWEDFFFCFIEKLTTTNHITTQLTESWYGRIRLCTPLCKPVYWKNVFSIIYCKANHPPPLRHIFNIIKDEEETSCIFLLQVISKLLTINFTNYVPGAFLPYQLQALLQCQSFSNQRVTSVMVRMKPNDPATLGIISQTLIIFKCLSWWANLAQPIIGSSVCWVEKVSY